MKEISTEVRKGLVILGWVVLIYGGIFTWIVIGFLFHEQSKALWFSLVWSSVIIGIIMCPCIAWWNRRRRKK